MELYPVTVDWIPGLPQRPYRGGVGQWEGVVLHDTANPNDTARSNRIYEGRTFESAFVHEFIDPCEIIQVADPQYIAYGAGPVANQRFIHLELCSAETAEEFEQAFDRWCQRAAWYLAEAQLPVIPAKPDGSGTLWGHFEVSGFLGGSDHMDPLAVLEKWGKTWDDVIARVTQHHAALTQKGGEGEVKLEEWQWQMAEKVMDEYNKRGVITDANWTIKIQNRELTVEELAWLNLMIGARRDGITI